MLGAWEVAGWVIVLGALAQICFGLYESLARRITESQRARTQAANFAQRAAIVLDAERADRNRHELSWSGFRKFKIDRKVEEAQGVCSFYLKPHDGESIPSFKPGQYLTFKLNVPDQPRPVTRCYSLSESPTENDYYRVTIKRVDPPMKKPEAPPGISSSFFHRKLEEGDIVDVKAPSGRFFLDQTSERPVVLIGGGIGLTPLLSMLNTICNSGSNRETWFIYGVNDRNDHVMHDHLNNIRTLNENVNIVVCYSRFSESDVKGIDYDVEGYVSLEVLKELLPSNNYEFYICGPPPMMDSITVALKEWGVPDDDVNFEAFGPASVKRKPTTDGKGKADKDAARSHEVLYARSSKTIAWTPDSGSLLDLAEANGINLDFGCRAGSCGTCLTAIKEGSVEYLSEPDAEPESGACLACIAIPCSNLVLDG